MKICNPSTHKSTIYNLIDGTVFQYDGHYYIKTDEHNSNEQKCFCVCLSNGRLTQLYDLMMVEYYEAEVTLK